MNSFNNIHKHEIAAMAESLTIPSDEFTFRRILTYIDFTSLNITDTEESIGVICDKLNNFPFIFPDLPQVAAICVYPRFIRLVKEKLTNKRIRIASVGGSFPSSQSFTSIKAEECRMAVAEGADEIDMVLSAGDFIAGNLQFVTDEIIAIKEAIGKAHLKVILETGVIDSPELIYEASMLAMKAGADFIKTSTGKEFPGASLEAVEVMAKVIAENTSSQPVGIKISGGVRTYEDALTYLELIENHLGREFMTPERVRVGASSLIKNLMDD